MFTVSVSKLLTGSDLSAQGFIEWARRIGNNARVSANQAVHAIAAHAPQHDG